MKQETIEDIAKWVIEFRITKNEYARVSDFEMYHTIIEKVSKWQQERSYSKQDMIKLFDDYNEYLKDNNFPYIQFEQWLKAFKKE